MPQLHLAHLAIPGLQGTKCLPSSLYLARGVALENKTSPWEGNRPWLLFYL